VGVFERLLNQVLDEKLVPVYAQIDALESKMMDRFNIVLKTSNVWNDVLMIWY